MTETSIKDLILTLCLNNDLHPDKKRQVVDLLLSGEVLKNNNEPTEVKPEKIKAKRGRKIKDPDSPPAELLKSYKPIEVPPLRKDMTPEEKRERKLIQMRACKQKKYYLDPEHREESIKRCLKRYHEKKNSSTECE